MKAKDSSGYYTELIGHTFEGDVVGARPYDQPKVIQSHQEYSRSRLVLI